MVNDHSVSEMKNRGQTIILLNSSLIVTLDVVDRGVN